MASKLNISFASPMSIGSRIQFYIGSNIIYHDVVTVRQSANQVTRGNTLAQFLNNYISAIMADYSVIVTAVARDASSIQVQANSVNQNFYSGTSFGSVVVPVFQYENGADINFAPTLRGLSNNYYLINNDIYISLASTLRGGSFRVRFENQTNQVSTEYAYASQDSSGLAIINITSYLKSIFTYPKHSTSTSQTINVTPNMNVIKIYYSYVIAGQQRGLEGNVTKNFIRGGRRTTETNIFINGVGSVLTPENINQQIPFWSDYPITISQIDGNVIKNFPINNSNRMFVENMRVKGCQNVYVKFLNQNGGYSYWLFENYADTESAAGLGTYVRAGANSSFATSHPNTGITDLGVNATETIVLSSKVPDRFLNYMKDLIVSPEIYIYRENEWRSVSSVRNSASRESNRRAYNTKITLEINNRFNPSLLWSN